ncbi:hypothetical protein [Amycolatopsis sp. NBRC 101858]|nr:hypothetical protein [Amycolatopsis sp. NBRC 101858]
MSTPVALLIATVLMERFERRCTLSPAAKAEAAELPASAALE